MRDPYNPTLKEIKEWAYNDEFYPVEDWDIIVFHYVTNEALNALVLDVASDEKCPKQESFIHFLNVMTGGVVRYAAQRGFEQKPLTMLKSLIEKAEHTHSPLVLDWVKRSKRVIRAPKTFCYDDWF